MIDTETAREAYALLGTAILEMLEDAAGAAFSTPRDPFQRRTHMADLAKVGRDIEILATAAVILSRRSVY